MNNKATIPWFAVSHINTNDMSELDKGVAIRTFDIARGQKFCEFIGKFNVDLITMFHICRESIRGDMTCYIESMLEENEDFDESDCNYEEEFNINDGYFYISWLSEDDTFGVEGYLIDSAYHQRYSDEQDGFEPAEHYESGTTYTIDGIEELKPFHSRILDDDQGWGILEI